MTDQPNEGGSFAKILKWIGYCTAILSFLATLGGLGKYAWDKYDTNRKIDVLISAEAVQLQGHDYSAAWESLEQASKIKPASAKVKTTQLALAKEWVEDVPVQQTGEFRGFAAKLNSILTQALAQTKPGPAHADLLADLGWLYFRQDFEGTADLNPEEPYAKAAAEDPNNPYAQAMWGYWLLYYCGQLEKRRPWPPIEMATTSGNCN